MDRVYRVVVGVAVFILRAMRWDPEVHGLEHIPTEGPALIASNHIGLIDWTFLGRAVVPIDRFRQKFGDLQGPAITARIS